jgi:head-tail adaptor
MDKTPFIGSLDTKITIINIVNSRNSINVNKPKEITVAEPYANMQDISGDEEVEGKVFHLIDRKYTIRYREEIAKKGHEMLLLHDGEKFKIKHVKQIGRRNYLELICERNE